MSYPIPTPMTDEWATPGDNVNGWIVEGTWHGAIEDQPMVTALVVSHPALRTRRLVFFCRTRNKLRSIHYTNGIA